MKATSNELFLEIVFLYLLHLFISSFPCLEETHALITKYPHPPRLTNQISFSYYKGMSSRIKCTKSPAPPLQISVILSVFFAHAQQNQIEGLFYFNLISHLTFSSFTCMRMEMVVAVQPPGASQEPKECQHRQCFQ